MRKLTVGLLGTGSFGVNFIPLLQRHPWVEEVRIAEVRSERRGEVCRDYGISTAYASDRELFSSDVDAVFIFVERMRHFEFAKAALLAGKHVCTAVPMANTVEEIEELIELVRRTGLTYQMAETSVYYPAHLYCRQRFQAGEMGRFVYGEGEYYHDMAMPGCPFYEIYKAAHGDDWRKFAGFPPMLYPTHSASMVLGVTGAHMTHVSCLGLDDTAHEDGCWGEEKNHWNNPFSSQCALFQTSDGGMARINEFRRVGISHSNEVRLSIFGTKASFEEQSGSKSGVCMFTTLEGERIDPTDEVYCVPGSENEADPSAHWGMAKIHPIERLPMSYKGLRNGHYGSHHFLIDDFVKACVRDRLPPTNVWQAARYNLPGIVAHASALRDGERLPVPDFGDPVGELLHVNERAE